MEQSQYVLVVVLFTAAFGAVLTGIPVAFALSGAALLVASSASLLGLFDFSLLGAIPSRIFGTAMFNEVLTAVPMFILMGVILERSRIAEELLSNMARAFGRLPAGLGLSVTMVGALLAASTGIVGATVVAMGLLSLPTMLKRGYDPALACGSICAAGTLGQIIPPSIVLVLLGDQLSGAYMEAQREVGNFSPEPVSVGDLFAGALIPGVGLAVMYASYQLIVGLLSPRLAPPLSREELDDINWPELLVSLLAPLLLILSVLGSILSGIATPTEAAGIGALGALLLAARSSSVTNGAAGSQTPPLGSQRELLLPRIAQVGIVAALALPVLRSSGDLRLTLANVSLWNYVLIGAAAIATMALISGICAAIYLLHRRAMLNDIVQRTMRINALAFVILIGATIFSLVFRGVGGDDVVMHLMEKIPGGPIGAVLAVSLLVFVLGFFLDFIEIVFIIMPIVAPVILQSDINPVWFGVLIAINLQTSFLTPPFGFALFYLKGVAPKEVTTMQIYRGVLPFILIQLTMLMAVFIFPGLATWLPAVLFK